MKRVSPVAGVFCVPQIWLTYDELAMLIDCHPDDAPGAATVARLDRRRSRDGTTRVKLTPFLVEAFLDRILREREESRIASDARALRMVHGKMAAYAPSWPRIARG